MRVPIAGGPCDVSSAPSSSESRFMRKAETTVCARLGEMLVALESDIVRGRRAGEDTPSNGVVSSGCEGRWGACAEVKNEKSSESPLLISTVGRRRLCRRSREGYGGGGSYGTTFRVPSVTTATGGSGDMARLGCAGKSTGAELGEQGLGTGMMAGMVVQYSTVLGKRLTLRLWGA